MSYLIYDKKSNDAIWDMINSKQYAEAEVAIRERLSASNLTPKQVGALMYYAYDHGHSSGDYEVLLIAMNLLNEIVEA